MVSAIASQISCERNEQANFNVNDCTHTPQAQPDLGIVCAARSLIRYQCTLACSSMSPFKITMKLSAALAALILLVQLAIALSYREKTKQAALAKNSAAGMTYMTSTKKCIGTPTTAV